ncbi:anti-repressor SinI family protein [Evansella sp. AB-rgal1]
MERVSVEEGLDNEWFHLIQEARQMGLSVEEIQAFLSDKELE